MKTGGGGARNRRNDSPLSERERRFVEFYMGEAAGNATKAARFAGYSAKTARKQGSRLRTKGHIRAAIQEAARNDPAVWTREDRQRFWTAVAAGAGGFAKATLRDRLKASELLGRSQSDFFSLTHLHQGRITLEEALEASHK